MFNARRIILFASCLACLAVLLGMCLGSCASAPLLQTKQRLLKMTDAELAPFTKDDIVRVADSIQHLRHVSGQHKCMDCHFERTALNAAEGERNCRKCHEARMVDNRIWKHHCQSCHPFDPEHEVSKGGFDALKTQCQECHPPAEGSDTYGACKGIGEGEKACKQCHKVHSGKTATAPPQALTFAQADQERVLGNQMHAAHNAKDVKCVACHFRTLEITAADAVERCSDCHASKIVAASVWSTHCLSCHAFTKTDEHALGTPRVAQRLCEECHTNGDPTKQNVIYGFCNPGSMHHIDCNTCHQPHKTAIVASQSVCTNCHDDIAGQTHPSKKVHGSCIMCHSPHIKREPGSKLCTKCHLANQAVLVHRIPGHPTDCLECHTPHFTETEIIGDACIKCHQGMFYAGGRNSPKDHRRCENCHDIASFRYEGDGGCANCHKAEGRVINNKQLNIQHRYCGTCHKPHIWRATFESSCSVCHQTELVLEHNIPQHKLACDKCHDAHAVDTMPDSGNCDGCHKQLAIPAFKPSVNEQHLTCSNCHSPDAIATRKYSFVGADGSCLVCHASAGGTPDVAWSAVPSGHQMCNACHAAHTFKVLPGPQTCGACHSDAYANPPAQQHSECFNCHVPSHQAEFSGDFACTICHSQAAEQAGDGVKAQCTTCHGAHEFKADPNSCGTCHGEVQQQAAGANHGDCQTCHGSHKWQPGTAPCLVCHAERPGLHTVEQHSDCLNCHPMHSMRGGTESCATCHPQRPASCTSDSCMQCHKFSA